MEANTNTIVQEISGAVTKNRKRLMGFGILSLIFGIIGTFMSVTMTMTSMIFFFWNTDRYGRLCLSCRSLFCTTMER